MVDAPRNGSRGMVITGGIITGISLLITGAAVVYFVTGVITSPEAMSMVFPFLLLGWITFGLPTWFIGVPVLAIGRSRQRGPVKGATAAWIVALAGLPVVGFLLGSATSGSIWVFYALVVAIPLAIVTMIVGLIWLVWGKPAHLVSG